MFMSQKLVFDKPAISVESQINLLKKNIIIDNIDLARHCPNTIGYYRLMIYFKPFLSKNNSDNAIKPSIPFQDILQLYLFDRELRLLVADAIERIEVAFRTAISNTMSLTYGPHWYLKSKLFSEPDSYKKFLDETYIHLKRSHEDFIKNYYTKYHEPEHPPSWMVMECISFGTVSKLYSIIKDRSSRKKVGDMLGQYSEIIKSWMKALTYTRNLCAHHSRLWNRFFINKPQVNIEPPNYQNLSPFYLQAYILDKLLYKISPHNNWKKNLYDLFKSNLIVPFSDMGFSKNWQEDEFWK